VSNRRYTIVCADSKKIKEREREKIRKKKKRKRKITQIVVAKGKKMYQ